MDSVSWTEPGTALRRSDQLQLLGFNDFHGHLAPPVTDSPRPAGGAAALAAYLKAAERAAPGRTLILHAGDQLGASPPATRLLRNEPGIEFLNLLASKDCRYGNATRFFDAAHWRRHPNRCNVVGTLGNHEFDGGIDEIRRLLDGGNANDGPFLEDPYRGSRVPYVCSNVIERRTGKPLLPPYAVVSLRGIAVGVIGAVLRETPTIVPAWGVKDVEFIDEAQAINAAAAQLTAHGVRILVVIIHQGLIPVPSAQGYDFQGPLRSLVSRLDGSIDVVVSGHTHNYSNTLLPNKAGKPVLVTQAYSYGIAFAQIQLRIDRQTHRVIAKSARIVPTFDDAIPGGVGDAQAQALADAAKSLVDARVRRVVGTVPQAMTRAVSPAGESSLGDLVADAQRAATHADIALMNAGGLRSDLHAGSVTVSDVLTLQPFANHLVSFQMSGAQLLQLLEQQWPTDSKEPVRMLKTSGLHYSWDAARPPGARVVAACDATGSAIDPARRYRVTVNDFLAAGGDAFTLLPTLGEGETGPLDADALETYLQNFSPTAAGSGQRVARTDLGGPAVCDQP